MSIATSLPQHMIVIPTTRALPPKTLLRRAALVALEFSMDQVL